MSEDPKPLKEYGRCDPDCPFFRLQDAADDAFCLKCGTELDYYDGFLALCEAEPEAIAIIKAQNEREKAERNQVMSEPHESDTEEKNAAMADLAADIEAAKKAELKSCPFCGKPGYKKVESDHHGTFFSLGCSDKLCPAHLLFYTAAIEGLPLAVRFWNERPSQACLARAEADKAWKKWESVKDDHEGAMQDYIKACLDSAVKLEQAAVDASLKDVNELLAAYDDYLKLLGEEIDGLVGLAPVHGWKSSRYEQGCICRERIGKAKKALGLLPEQPEKKEAGDGRQKAD